MNKNTKKKIIVDGKSILGIELGSTRIKAVLIDKNGEVLATGGQNWENHFENNIWTYPLDEVWSCLASCYQDLSKNVKKTYDTEINNIEAIGISGMMHGYLPFDKNGNQIAKFRTWRNSNTGKAAKTLTKIFNYNIPLRWSIAHLYQSILDNESHVEEVDYLTTLAGYVHWKLTGKKVIGVGDASGMFPIDIKTHNFNYEMLEKFSELIKYKNYKWEIRNILPEVLVAGQDAGRLTNEGAKLLDVSGKLQSGAIACPPEGDAGTGMVATNSLAKRTGNISAGTSAFAMLVLEKELKELHTIIDMVTTPAGDLVAMSHASNCTTEINTWVSLFKELLKITDTKIETNDLYNILFKESLNGDADCGDLLPYCFHSGEDIVGLELGCPSFIHPTNSSFNLANFIRAQIYSCFAAMKIGMDVLIKEEGAKIDKMLCHGGIFKTEGVAQRFLAAALSTRIETFNTSSEGGAWGIALLAAYTASGAKIDLSQFVNKIFETFEVISIDPISEEVAGYEKFIEAYKRGLPAEKELTQKFN